MDGLLRVTAPHEWVVLAGLAVVVMGSVLWVIFGSIERSFTVQCVLASPGERHLVVAESGGQVMDVLASPGESVAVGQAIARIRVPELSRDLALARARLSVLEEMEGTSPDALAAARAELIGIETLQASGEFIVSSYSGELASHTLVPGQSLIAGDGVAVIRSGSQPGLEAVALLDSENARRVSGGMQARVVASSPGREAQPLEATVTQIAERAGPAPGWLAVLGLDGPGQSHLVRISLPDAPAHLTGGSPCSLQIVLGEGRPVGLITSLGVN